jgi:dipeptidase
MGSDLVVALGRATVNGQTLFGQNCHDAPFALASLCLRQGKAFAPDEVVRTRFTQLPQVRQTCTVLGCQADDTWGYRFGVNEHQLAAGCGSWESRLERSATGLLGTELLRLTLERASNARRGVEVLTDLLARHGQADGDHTFLIADPVEAFTIEAAGDAWALQQIQEVRAVSDLAVIRQDWNRIAAGLADRAIARGWWPEDGSKLDFAGTLGQDSTGRPSALRRWGRATLLLEQQNGHIDAAFVRRLLSDHYEGTRSEVDPLDAFGRVAALCQHATGGARSTTTAGFVAALSADAARVPVVWCAPGSPCLNVHFPLFLDGELPEGYTAGLSPLAGSLWRRARQLANTVAADPGRLDLVRDALGRLQGRFDQEAEEFNAEAVALKRSGSRAELYRVAGSLMQHQLERFDEVAETLLAADPLRAGLTVL